MSKPNFPHFFHSTWLNAGKLHNTSIGFKEAGIWPFNPDAVLGVGADKEYSHLNEGASVGLQSGGEREDECGGDS